LRILYLVHQFAPEFVGGTEIDTWEVAHRMQARGHRVAIVHRAPGRRGVVHTNREGIPVIRLEFGPTTRRALFAATFGHPALARAVDSVSREFHPDLLHVQHLRGLPPTIVASHQVGGCPVVISLRDYWFACSNAELLDDVTGRVCTHPGEAVHCARCAMVRSGARGLLPIALGLAPILGLRNRILKGVLRHADGLLVYSEFVRQWFARYGVGNAPLHLVRRGIPRPRTMPDRSDGDMAHVVRLGYIGGLAWEKGVHVVLEAVSNLPETVELVVAGDDTKHPDYVAYLKSLVHHPGIRFVGRLNRDGVWSLLARLDAVVVPSLWFETFSMVTHEALAMGVPAIVSGHGVLADVIEHGVNGLCVPPGDVDAWRGAISEFVRSPSLRQRLQYGIKPPPDMDEYVNGVQAVYEEVLSRGRSGVNGPGTRVC